MQKNSYTQDYIKDLVARAAQADPEYKVFGASAHKYQLNPPVSLDEVRALEEKLQIKLPEDYVYFLTQISNGGAGPYYGLCSLEKLECQRYAGQNNMPDNMQEPFIDKSLTREKWKEAVELMEDGDDKVYRQIITGVFTIGTQGCTYDSLLMCGGSEKGKIVYIDWNLDDDENPPFLTKMTFWDWYIGFFEDIISGCDMDAYGYYKRGTEKELREAYYKATDPQEKLDNIQGLMRFHKLSAETIDYLYHIEDEEADETRLILLLKHAPELGMKVFDELIAGKNISAAVSCVFRIPKEERKQYYQRAIEILYTRSDCVTDTLLFFIASMDMKKASDLIGYATNPATKGKLLKTAVYVIGKCEDAMDYEEQFIKWMRGDDDMIAQAALLASESANLHSPALVETYQWMAEKYKEDCIMMNDIRRVL